jgi:hypothetical protein
MEAGFDLVIQTCHNSVRTDRQGSSEHAAHYDRLFRRWIARRVGGGLEYLA